MKRYACQAEVGGGSHPGAIYRIIAGGWTFNACYRCVGALGYESRRTGLDLKAERITPTIRE